MGQPLHVGYIGDEGGNKITVRWYRRKTNLHHVYPDSVLVKDFPIFGSFSINITVTFSSLFYFYFIFLK